MDPNKRCAPGCHEQRVDKQEATRILSNSGPSPRPSVSSNHRTTHQPPRLHITTMKPAIRNASKALRSSSSRIPSLNPNGARSNKPLIASVVRSFASTAGSKSSSLSALDTFQDRHIGPNASETVTMLTALGYNSSEEFVRASVPDAIRVPASEVSNQTIPSLSERELLDRARELAANNKAFRSYIGMGYHNAVVPPVILRNVRLFHDKLRSSKFTNSALQVFESPAWYTPYTPYQPEISQGLQDLC